MQIFEVSQSILSGIGGAVIGVTGTLIGVHWQNHAADKRQRADLAARFHSRAERLGVQAMRDARRAWELDAPIEPGWDLDLIEMAREIALRYDARTMESAEKVVECLGDIVETGTVGSMMCFDRAMDEFASQSRMRQKRKTSNRERPRMV